jgi:hypothetical protein
MYDQFSELFEFDRLISEATEISDTERSIFAIDPLFESNTDTPEHHSGTPVPPTQENLEGKVGGQGFVKIPIPASKEITADTYNKLIDMTQKTLKEATEAINMLKDVHVVGNESSLESLQEQAELDAISEAYLNGPIFEAVKDPNKKEIRTTVKALRERLKAKSIQGSGWAVGIPKVFNRFFSWRTFAVIYTDGAKAPKAALNKLESFVKAELGDGYEIKTSAVMNSNKVAIEAIFFPAAIYDFVKSLIDGTQHLDIEIVELYKKES